jgi:hypothetical protein
MKYFVLTLALLLGSVGCGAADDAGATDTGVDTGTDTSTTDTTTDSTTDDGTDTDTDTGSDTGTEPEVPEIADLSGLSLTGVEPAENLEAPEFELTASDGTTRTEANLMGQPTVMWFFPAAESWSVG